jgi:hypothetical protein
MDEMKKYYTFWNSHSLNTLLVANSSLLLPMIGYLYIQEARFLLPAAIAVILLLVAYLVRLNQLLSSTPPEIKQLKSTTWTRDLLLSTYRRLEAKPITTRSYAARIPPKLERRYIVTGGSGEY